MAADNVRTIHPVILSGGSGSRLWPISRAGYPKQFLDLVGDNTLLQDTVARVQGERFAAPMFVCNDEHRFILAEQLRAAGFEAGEIVLEPAGRNTAPAAALAAHRLLASAGEDDALMLVMPSDHVIQDTAAFRNAIEAAAPAAVEGALLTFGVAPTAPETGYGYIKRAERWADHEQVDAVAAFVEKPDAATAERYLADGSYLWNSGIFLFSAKAYLRELEQARPEIAAACHGAAAGARDEMNFCRPDAEAFLASPSDSIDYAVMEHTANAAVVPVEMGWTDLGSWTAVADTEGGDDAGNVAHGDVLLHDTRNSYVRTDHPLVAVAGLENVIVVATDDAVLVTHRDRAQDVKHLAERLKADGRGEHALHTTVYRPWGAFQGIDLGDRHQVKRITVKPGGELSLQMHHHRAEHWIVVQGTAKVVSGDDSFLLRENESTYIPIGMPHRLENPGKIPLHLIEVQSGSYLGEDDIVRYEDGYGRTN